MKNKPGINRLFVLIFWLISFQLHAQNTCMPKIIPSGSTSICQGQTVTLTSTPAVKYLWSPGNQTTQAIVVNTSGIYIVSATDSSGCVGKNYIQVTVSAPLYVAISANGSTNLCANSSLVLSAVVNSSSTGYSYQWSNAATSQSINVSSPGTYFVYITNTNACIGKSLPILVTGGSNINPPIISASGALKFCQGGSVKLAANGSYTNYLWSNGSTDKTIMLTTSGSYTVSTKDSLGCYASSSPVIVSAEPAPLVKIIQNGSFCAGSIVTLMAYPTTNTNTGFTYLWSNAASTQTISITAAGTYSVKVTGANGCSTTTSILVAPGSTVINPVITASGPTTFCQGSSVTLTASSGYAKYVWSNGETTQSIVVTASGSYGLYASSTSGCSGKSNVINVIVIPPIQLTISLNGSNYNCNGSGLAILTALAQNYPGLSYLWSNGLTTQIISVSNTGNYSVTVTAPGGCKATANINVSFNSIPPPTVTYSGSLTFCQGDSTILTASSGYSSYLWSTGETTKSITVKNSGMYFITVKNTAGCVSASLPISIKVVLGPTASIYIKGNANLCSAGLVNLYAMANNSNINIGLSYLWSNGATTQNINISSPGIYTVFIKNANGCTSKSAPVTITGYSINAPIITASGPLSFCYGGKVTLTASSGYASYLWSNGATTQSINVNSSAVYWVNVKNSSSCSAISKSIQVIVLPAPYVTISSSNINLCKGAVVLQAVAPSGTQNVSYLWSNGANTQSITATNPGTYSVTATNAYGCIAVSSGQIVIGYGTSSNVPVITASGSLKFCSGDSLVLKASSGFLNYLWSNGATTSFITVKTSGSYTVLSKDSSGCSVASSPVIVSVEQKPMVQIIAKGNLCKGIDTLTAYVSNSTPNSFLYNWSNGASTQTILVTAAGTYTVTVSSTNGCSTVSAPYVVKSGSVLQAPAISASGPLKFCVGDSVKLSTAATYSNYQWSNGATTSSIVVKTSGTYSLYVKDVNGCVANSAYLVVNVEQKPIVQIYTAGNLCAGADTLYAYASPSNLNYLYKWSNGSTAQMIILTSAGSYSVSVTSSNGCVSNSASVTVQGGSLPTPIISNASSLTLCPGSSLTFSAPAGYAYMWSNQATTQSITVTSAGTYYVTIMNTAACKATSASVNVQQISVAVQPGAQVVFCNSGSLYAIVSPASTGITYQWTYNGVPILGATSLNYLANATGSYNAIVTNGSCVINSSTIYVTIAPKPIPIITVIGSTNICQTGSVLLSGSGGIGSGTFTYQWKLNGVDITGATAQTYTAAIKGTYTLLVTNSYKCSETSLPVSVSSCRMAKPLLEPFGVNINPNPSSSEFNVLVSCNNQSVNINIYDLTGRLIEKSTHSTASHIVFGNSLRQGIYIAEISSGNERTLLRIVKTE